METRPPDDDPTNIPAAAMQLEINSMVSKDRVQQAEITSTIPGNTAKQLEKFSTPSDTVIQSEKNLTVQSDAAKQLEKIPAIPSDAAKQSEKNSTVQSDAAEQLEKIPTIPSDVAKQSEKTQTVPSDVAKQSEKVTTIPSDTAKQSEKSPTVASDPTSPIDGCQIFINDVKNEQDDVAIKTEDISENEEEPIAKTFITQNVQIVTSAVNGLPGGIFVGYQCSVCYVVFPTYTAFNDHQLAELHYKENLNLDKNNRDVIVRCIDCFNGRLNNCSRCKIFAGNESCCRKLLGSLQCSQCTGIFSSLVTFNAHHCLSKHQPKALSEWSSSKEKENYDCKFCLQSFTTKQKLRNHTKKHKPSAETCTRSSTEYDPSDQTAKHCTGCKKSFNSASELVHHECVYNKSYSCNSCGEQIQGYYAYRSHTEKCRENIGTIQPLTQKGIESIKVEEEAETDMSFDTDANETADSPMQCLICNKVIEDKQALKKHMASHMGEGSDAEVDKKEGDSLSEKEAWKANNYGKECESPLDLTSGKKSQAMNQFMCNFCGKLIQTYEGVQTHVLNHKKDMLPHHQQQLEKGEFNEFFQKVENEKIVTPSSTTDLDLSCTYIDPQDGVSEEMSSNEETNGEEKSAKTGVGRVKRRRKRARTAYNDRTGASLTRNRKKGGSNTSESKDANSFLIVQCSLCDLTFKDRDLYAAHMKQEHNRFCCKNCNREYKSAFGLWRHAKTYHEESEEIFLKCQFCGKVCSSYERRQQHVKFYHQKEYEEMKTQDDKGLIKEVYTCPVCAQEFAIFAFFRKHFKEKHPLEAKKEVEEIEGGKKTGEDPDQGRSGPEEQQDKKVWQCNECDQSFAYKSQVWYHKKQIHRGKFSCKVCFKEFKKYSACYNHTRRKHMVGEVNEKGEPVKGKYHRQGPLITKVSTCTICNKELRSSLKKHMARHRSGQLNEKGERRQAEKLAWNERKYMCALCPKTFSSATALKSHEEHHEGNTFTCTEPGCNRSYSMQSSLKQHIQTHHVIGRAHQCAQCGKCFFNSRSLNLHMRTHTGERSFVCTICQQAFRYQTTLNNHMQSHLNMRNYACPHCDHKFNSSKVLKMHLRTHNKVKPHRCEQCGASFTRRYALTQHQRTHFSTEYPPPNALNF